MDFESLIIYSTAMLISCSFAYLSEKTAYKHFFFWMSFLSIAVFCAIRFDVGFDYRGYMSIFYYIQNGEQTYIEPGYYWLNKLFSGYENGYIYVLGIMTCLTYGLLFATFKHQENLSWNVYFLFAFQLLFQLNNQVRQGFVIAAFYFALYYLHEKKYWKYILLILISGLLIHHSSLILLLVPLIRNMRLTPKSWVCLIALSFLLYSLGTFKELGSFVIRNVPFYEKYLTYGGRAEIQAHTNMIIVLFWVLVGIVIALNQKWISNKLYWNLYLLGIVLYPIVVDYHLLDRMNLYFVLLNGLLAADICKRNKQLAIAFVGISFLIFGVYAIMHWGLAGGYPYYTIFGSHTVTLTS